MPASSSPASRNACTACTLAKRACDRQLPRCGRCQDKLVDCQYYGRPRPGRTRNRPSLLAPRPTHQQSLPTNISQRDITAPQALDLALGSLLARTQSPLVPVAQPCPDMPHLDTYNSLLGIDWPNPPYQPVQIPQSIFIPTPHYNHHPLPPKIFSEQGWFLHADSWQIKRTYVPSLADPHSVFKAFAKSVKAWLRDFSTSGHNIFIHRHLYHSSLGGMPTSLQDAYLTLTAYLTKTEQTENLIMQILDDRAARLLYSQHFTNLLPPDELDIRAQLANTQALLIYTFLRLLFDNPPEQRTKALDSLPILQAWCLSLCDAAIAQAPSLYLSSDTYLVNLASGVVTQEEMDQTSLWHAFIISESIRRTWMLVSSILRTFNQPPANECMDLTTVTQHRCLGFLSFTIRAGLWDAENAYQWGRLHSSYSRRTLDKPLENGMAETDRSEDQEYTSTGVPSDEKLWSESKKTIITTFIHDSGMDDSSLGSCAVDQNSGLGMASSVSMHVTPVFLESIGILDKILEETTPEDVDSWTNQILRMVLPGDKIDRWDGKMRDAVYRGGLNGGRISVHVGNGQPVTD